jgi:hypothetical protein
MEIMLGIATDYGQDKFNVSLDETDLMRLACEYGITPDLAQLTTTQVTRLLTLECERFVLIQAPKYGRPVDVVKEQLRGNREQFARALVELTGLELAECRKRVGLPDD